MASFRYPKIYTLFSACFAEGAGIQSKIRDNIKVVESNQQHIVTNDLVLHGNYIYTLVSCTLVSAVLHGNYIYTLESYTSVEAR